MSELHTGCAPSGSIWYREKVSEAYEFRFEATRELVRCRSDFQEIVVADTPMFGRILRLDDCNMTSEVDEYVYHELMTHPALSALAQPRRALIVGGGDGGAAKEILKYASVTQVVIAELDPAVVAISREYLSKVHCGAFDDARVSVHFGDGFETLKRAEGLFDLIVMDLTDPVGAAKPLYSEEFFRCASSKLSPSGVLSTHVGAPLFHSGRVALLRDTLQTVFAHVSVFDAHIPFYGGLWSVAHSSNSPFVADGLVRTLPHGLRYFRC